MHRMPWRVSPFHGYCNGRIFYLFILSYRTCLSYLITVLVLSFPFTYGCGLVSS